MKISNLHITNKWIVSSRGQKNDIDPHRPYSYLVEKERMPDGEIEDVATVFLTNKECPFRCLMCDLWKNTTDGSVPVGAIPTQLEYALERMPTTKHIKLYNSGNFFDTKAISPSDHKVLVDVLHGFETVLVESHPKFIDSRVMDFRDKLNANLQVAIGLETIHQQVLPKLNKQMTIEDFRRSVQFLEKNDILSRAFILLRPPFLSELEGIAWAKKSIDFAFDCGVECCVVIPTRSGNGALDLMEKEGFFHEPKISSLEEVLDYGIVLNRSRVFADLWDLKGFSSCDQCFTTRKDRLERMNLNQQFEVKVSCECKP